MDGHVVLDRSFTDYDVWRTGAVAPAMVVTGALVHVKAGQMIYGKSYEVRPSISFVGDVGIFFKQI